MKGTQIPCNCCFMRLFVIQIQTLYYLSTQYIIFTMMDTNHDANHVSFPRNPHPKVAFWKQGQPISAVLASWMPKGLLGHSWLKGIGKLMKRQEVLKPRRSRKRPCQISEPSASLMWYKVYTVYVMYIYIYVYMYISNSLNLPVDLAGCPMKLPLPIYLVISW